MPTTRKCFLVNSNKIHAHEVAKIELENSERFHVKRTNEKLVQVRINIRTSEYCSI